MGNVPFPDNFTGLTIPLRAVNFDFLSTLNSVLGKEQCRLALGFHSQTIVHVSIPPLFVIVVLCAHFVIKCTKKAANTNEAQRHFSRVAKTLILGTLLLYPGLATRLFSLLNCTKIDGVPGHFLVEDMSEECYQGDHAVMVLVGLAFMILYILGIPLFMFLALFRNRHVLWDDSQPSHEHASNVYGGLYQQCEFIFWHRSAHYCSH